MYTTCYNTIKKGEWFAHPVASKTITVSEMVMRAIPLVMAAAPINAYVPLSAV